MLRVSQRDIVVARIRLPAVMLLGLVLHGTMGASVGLPEDRPQLRTMDPAGERLRDLVIHNIRKNYFRLPSVRCKQIRTIVDFQSDSRSTVEFDLILARGNMRSDGLHRERDERWSISMHDDIYTAMFPYHKMARRHFREDLDEENTDPRNVGVLGQRQKLLKVLNLYQLVRYETIQRNGSERLRLEFSEEIVESGLIVNSRYEFDPTRNYLPTRIESDDAVWKRIAWVQDCEYQEVIPGNAWFLKKSRLRFLGRRRHILPDVENVQKEVTTEIVGDVQLVPPITDNELEIKIPEEIQLFDHTVGRSRPVR